MRLRLTMRLRRTTLLLALPATFLISACWGNDDQETPQEPTPATVEFLNVSGGVAYVGDGACASCHEKEYASFQNHGMARSMEPITDDLVPPDLPSPVVHHKATNLSYQVFKKGGKYYQEEFRLGPDGAKTHSLIREMMWVIGSGTIAHNYATVENERFMEMPLTWYTQRGKWDFSPNYQEFNLRFERALPDRCVACHNAYPTTVPNLPGAFESMGEGISCERCHGPGELHVNERLRNPEPASEIDPTIVNSKYLPLDASLDVCQQCHESATVSIIREGRGPFQFVPTERLESHVALYSEVIPASRQIGLVSHADRMKRSACFQALAESNGPMTCVTCHDPHRSFRDSGPEYFNAVCEGCHDQEQLRGRVPAAGAADHQTGTNCISCHMPKEDLWYIPHSAGTDHWVRVVGRSGGRQARRRPTGSSLQELELGAPEPYFEVDRSGPDAEVYLGVAYIVLGDQKDDRPTLERGVEILQEVLTDPNRFGDAHYRLGFSLFTLGRLQEAVEPLETALRLDPDDPERLNTLAQLYERMDGSPDRIRALYQRALEIQPLGASIRVNYGRFLETQSQETEARQEYEKALEDRPSLAAGHYNLGTLLIRHGDLVKGEQHLAQAITLDPDYSEAYSNLGVLLASEGRKDEARRLFEEAVEVAPDDPIALNNLASFYLNEGLDAKAVPLLKRATSAQPTYVEALANLALALLRVGADGEASTYADRALVLDPENVLAKAVAEALE